MAKKAKIQKYKKFQKECERLRAKREACKKIAHDPQSDPEARMKAQAFLQKTAYASKVRDARRCRLNGRPHGVYRFVGICRNEFRRLAMQGLITGVVKSSW